MMYIQKRKHLWKQNSGTHLEFTKALPPLRLAMALAWFFR